MRIRHAWPASVLVAFGLALPAPVPATDVDGGNDCTRNTADRGDAPEGTAAYPGGIIGHFPTCAAFTAAGTQTSDCAPISLPPGPTGHVINVNQPDGYWLGCGPTGGVPLGIDSEVDGKMNDTGLALSACAAGLAIDCVEPAFAMSFGQDECYGSSDAGIADAITFGACVQTSVSFRATNCGLERACLLNILVDWNEDGDWNDNLRCGPEVGCAYEWVVKNAPIMLPTGCTTLTSPTFLTGPRAGRGWMRITISDGSAPDDFPWAGSTGMPGGVMLGGETEDYPVTIEAPPLGVGDRELPTGLTLAAVSPNPSHDWTNVRFALPRDAEVRLGVFDVAGRKVIDLANEMLPAGEHTRTWNFRDASGATVPAGLYIIKLEAEGRVLTQRAIRVR